MNYNKFKKLMTMGVLIVKNGGDSESVDKFFKSNEIHLPVSMLEDFMFRAPNESVNVKCLEEK